MHTTSVGWKQTIVREVIFVAFIPFFALRELDRALGKGKLRTLFWRRVTPGAEMSRES